MGITFKYRYPNIRGSYYIHYIVRHVPEKVNKDVTWSQLQNQGEVFHSTDPQIKNSASSKNGGKVKIDSNLQKLLLLLHRIYLAQKHKLVRLSN